MCFGIPSIREDEIGTSLLIGFPGVGRRSRATGFVDPSRSTFVRGKGMPIDLRFYFVIFPGHAKITTDHDSSLLNSNKETCGINRVRFNPADMMRMRAWWKTPRKSDARRNIL